MSNLVSTLTVSLKDDVSGKARTIGDALKRATENAKALANTGLSSRFTTDLARLGLSAKDVNKVAASFRDYAQAAGLAGQAGSWTKSQVAQIRAWESATVASLRRVRQEMSRLDERRQARRDALGTIAAGAGIYAGHKVKEATRAVGHTYREFDKERRYGKAVMGLTDDEQNPLVRQAVHGGATTKYNDIQFLHGQRDLAARGVSKEAILGMMPHAANLGMATDQTLPDAVKMMENAIFTFQKKVDTVQDANASAKQTSDLIVKAMKASGMTAEDIGHAYKFGAPSANMGNLGENNLLTFAGLLKKAGIGGDQAGTAFRALTSTLFAPTAGAKTAMRARGMNYADYQKAPDSLALAPFVDNIAQKYGVALGKAAQAALGNVFGDKSLISDPAKFTPAIMKVLADHLGGDDAKSKKAIAGEANRYRDASIRGIDTNRMFRDLLDNLRADIGFANKLFGAKQGSRIATALKDPAVYDKLLKMLESSDGYAGNIAKERMAGFDGAASRLEGAFKNLETALGRSWDNDGKGGVLTNVTDRAAQFVQSLAEMNNSVLQVTSGLALIGGKLSGLTGAFSLVADLWGAKALTGSATALTGSAAALTRAAVALGAKGALPDVAGGGAAEAGKKGSKLAKVGKIVGGASAIGALLGGTLEFGKALGDQYGYRPASGPGSRSHAKRLREELDARPGYGVVPPAESAPAPTAMPGPKRRGAGSSAYAQAVRESLGGPPATPQVDSSSLDGLKAKAEAAAGAMKEIGVTVTPQVNTGGIDGVRTSADAALGALKGLNTTVTPQVDTSSLASALSIANSLKSTLSGLGALAGAAGRNLAAAKRGSFANE